MRMTERAVQFNCEGQRLLGVLSLPESPARTGVVIVVGGPQYRAGSHRQFVQLARHLAEGGHAVLRFDVRGMGDSEGEQRTFEQMGLDIGAAITAMLQEVSATKNVVLWGLCDGASAALLYLHERPDARVCGLALANPWVRSVAGQARAQVRHYYRQRLKEWHFWSRMLNPATAWRAAVGLADNLRAARTAPERDAGSFQERMASAWQCFRGPILLLQCEHDLTAREFDDALRDQAAWVGALAARSPLRVDLAGADHTCSQPRAQQVLQQATLQWLSTLTA